MQEGGKTDGGEVWSRDDAGQGASQRSGQAKQGGGMEAGHYEGGNIHDDKSRICKAGRNIH